VKNDVIEVFYDVILHCRAVEKPENAASRRILTVLGKFEFCAVVTLQSAAVVRPTPHAGMPFFIVLPKTDSRQLHTPCCECFWTNFG